MIGDNSLYDTNINIIQCMINFTNNKNKVDEIILKNYYLSYMLLYWQNFIIYLNDKKLFNTIRKNFTNSFNGNIEIILEKITLLDKYYNIKLDKYNYDLMMKKLRKICINYKNDYLFDCLYRTYPLIFKNEVFNKDILNQYRIIFAYNIKDKRRYIKDNITKFNNKFSIKYEEIQKSEILDNIKILRIFEYISNMFYYKFKYDKKKYLENIKRCFVIDLNYSTFNTILYSFFENIKLFYISSNIEKYDIIDKWFNDTKKIYKNYTLKYTIYKNIWLNILNSNISKLEKELYILVIFILIYENIYINKFNNDYQIYNYINNIKIYSFQFELNKYYIIYKNDFNKIKNYYSDKEIFNNELINAKTGIYYCIKNIVKF